MAGRRQRPGLTHQEVARAGCSIGPYEAPCTAVQPQSQSQGASLVHTVLRFEDVNSPHHVLPADGALAHPLPALGARYHVTTFQEHTIDDGVHADATQVFIRR